MDEMSYAFVLCQLEWSVPGVSIAAPATFAPNMDSHRLPIISLCMVSKAAHLYPALSLSQASAAWIACFLLRPLPHLYVLVEPGPVPK